MSDRNLVIVAYDGSEEAKKALEHAISMAEADDEIMILMIIPEPGVGFFGTDADILSVDEANNHLASLRSTYHDRGIRGIKITTKVKKGKIVDEIVMASSDPRCKLVVLGYKGVSKRDKFKLGVVSGGVAKHAKAPVLVVK